MKNVYKIFVIIAIAAIIIIGLGNCENSAGSPTGNNNTPQASIALRAEPVPASNNPNQPVVLDYFRVEDRNWYIIDAGFIANTFVSQLGWVHYNGITPVTLTIAEATETTVTSSVTSTVSESIGFIDATQTTKGISEEISKVITQGTTVGTTIGAGAGGDTWGVNASLERSLEDSLEMSHGVGIIESEEISRAISVSYERSLATSFESIKSLTNSLGQSVAYEIGKNNESAGWYRYALYSVSDVYFVISTDSNNQTLLSWDIVSAVRQSDYLPHFESSGNGRFDTTPIGGLIVFAEGFYKNLPKPEGYRLTANVNIANSGTIRRDPDTSQFNAGTAVTLIATANPGYEFVNWTGEPTGAITSANVIMFPMNSDVTITANFQPMYTLTTEVNVPGRGTISVSPDQTSYLPDTPVTVTATPANSSFRFEKWDGVPDGVSETNASISFNINSNVALRANFQTVTLSNHPEIFTSTGTTSWILPANVKYPAIIEIYTFGAGGGGQGGHYSWRLIGENRRGTGGAGGGGAATYAKFTTNTNLSFNVTVGTGGTGGNPRDSNISSWSAGYVGGNGTDTTVKWGDNTITARGGIGGGRLASGAAGGSRDLNGGVGGTAFAAWPSVLPAGADNRLAIAGSAGTQGNEWGDGGSRGGNAASLAVGSMNPLTGGDGGVRNNGEWGRKAPPGADGGGGAGAYGGVGSGNVGGDGGNGRVVIYVTWEE